MRLIKLKIQNVNSLAGVHEIDFSDRAYAASGIFAIVGPTGSGKTTVLDAITLALFGTTPRMVDHQKNSSGKECIVLTKGQKECSATVYFESGGKYWSSHWGQRLTRNHTLAQAVVELTKYSGPEDKTGKIVTSMKSQWARAVPEVLGMNFDTFMKSAILAQGAFARLLQAKADERGEILEKITGTVLYSAVGKLVYERSKEKEQLVKELEAQLEGATLLSEAELAQKLQELDLAKNQARQEQFGREECSRNLNWAKSLGRAKEDLVKAERFLAEAQKKALEGEEKKREYEAAIRAHEPAAQLKRVEFFEVQKQNALNEDERLERDLSDVERRARAAQAEALEAQAQVVQAKKRRDEAEPELEKMESLDAELSQKQAQLADAIKGSESQEKTLADAQTELDQRAARSDAAEKAFAAAKEALHAVEVDKTLKEKLPAVKQLAAALNAALRGRENAKRKFDESKAEHERIEKKSARSKADLERSGLARQEAFGRLEEARKALEIARAGSTVELKLLEMREAVGKVWAARWLKELGELLSVAQRLPECDGRRKVLEIITARSAQLRGRLSDAVAEFNVTQEDLSRLESSVERLESWSRSAGEAEEKAAALQTAFEKIDAKLNDVRTKEAQTAVQLEAAVRRTAENEQALAESSAILSQAQSVWFKALEECGADGHSDVQQTIDSLNARQKAYEAAQSRVSELEQALTAAAVSLTEAKARRDAAAGQFDLARKAAAEKTAVYQAALERRRSAYGERSAKAERNALEKACVESLDKAAQSGKTAEKLAVQLESLRGQAAENKTRLEALVNEGSAAVKRFEELLSASGFTDKAGLAAAARSQDEVQTLRNDFEQTQKSLAAAGQAQRSAQEKLAELLGEPHAEESVEALEVKLAHADERLAEFNRQVGQLGEQLAEDERKRSQMKELKTELEHLRQESALWDRLRRLIGSKTGKEFRNAAQQLTFALLLSEANKVLEHMQSRYRLVPSGSEGLDLSVRDLDLAGLERTSFNLSGGETFIVSLALALALSRISTRRMQVDTLFLDEGFGTLDAQVLERALNALEMLQQRTGKLIGLISHVRAVRERVGVHITVRPKGSSGESELSGPGIRHMESAD